MKRAIVSAGVAFSVLSSLSLASLAIAGERDMIDGAAEVFFTERGQAYFYDQLQDVLFANGYAFNDLQFDNWEYQAKESFDLDHPPKSLKKYKSTINEVRRTLRNWLIGFQLRNPKLALNASDISFKANFSRLGVRADSELSRKTGKEHAVVLVAEIEAPHFVLSADSIRAKDLSNPFLGQFGLNSLQVNLDSNGRPLKIQMPFVIEVVPGKGLVIRSLEIKTNLTAVKLETRFAHPLVMPQVEVRINGYRMKLDHSAIERDLIKQQDNLLKMLQASLKTMIEEQGPGIINSLLSGGSPLLEDINTMNPIGAGDEPLPLKERFIWGLKPAEVNQLPDFVHLKFDAFFADPKAVKTAILPSALRAKGRPSLTGMATTEYDLAVAVNQGIINKALQLSFDRGYFAKMKIGSGSDTKIIGRPELKLNHGGRPNHAKLHVRVDQKVSGYQQIAVKEHVQVEFDLDLRLDSYPNGGLKLVIDHIVEDSVKVDESSIRFSNLSGIVKNSVRDIIREQNDDFSANETSLTDEDMIPSALFGIPLKVLHSEVTESGHLVLYVRMGA